MAKKHAIRDLRIARSEWTKPEIRRMWAGLAEGAPAMAIESTSGHS
jgi:hypothetical protein